MARGDTIHEFWFGTLDAQGRAPAERQARWFRPDPDFDRHVRGRFEADLRAAASGRRRQWEREPRSALALVLLFDQFPRNMYRGTPRAFMFDARARACLEAALEQGLERALWPIERTFLFMPLQHAEDLAAQDESVHRFEALVAEVPVDQRDLFEEFARYAREHREVIAAFGRFPHRNAILGRVSSETEQEYLATGGANWGQGTG